MNMFNRAFAAANETRNSVMGQAVVVNGVNLIAVVASSDESSAKIAGGRSTNDSAIIHLTPADYIESAVRKGNFVIVGEARMRVMRINSLAGAGVELICEPEEQRRP